MSKESFVVSARKYRPTNFNDLVGQKAVAETLLHEIKSNKLAQAFLFTGPRGVGKTTSARILSKLINEEYVDADADLSFNIFELDAASRSSVEDMRELISMVRIPPPIGKYKVYIIDEVHMLSNSAFNAFLKTLEEPPSYAIFILATTEKHKVLPTIISRCQVFHFNRIEIPDIVKQLEIIAEKESIKYDQKSLFLIAQKADGGMRDALSLFDQLVSFSQGEIVYEKTLELLNIIDSQTYFDALLCAQTSDTPSALILLDTVVKMGYDASVFVTGLAMHVRNLIVVKNTLSARLLDESVAIKAKYEEQANELELGFLLNALNIINECDEKYATSRHPRLLVELMLMKLTQLNSLLASIDDLVGLKKKLESKEHSTYKFEKKETENPVNIKSLQNSRIGFFEPQTALTTSNIVVDNIVVEQNLELSENKDLELNSTPKSTVDLVLNDNVISVDNTKDELVKDVVVLEEQKLEKDATLEFQKVDELKITKVDEKNLILSNNETLDVELNNDNDIELAFDNRKIETELVKEVVLNIDSNDNLLHTVLVEHETSNVLTALKSEEIEIVLPINDSIQALEEPILDNKLEVKIVKTEAESNKNEFYESNLLKDVLNVKENDKSEIDFSVWFTFLGLSNHSKKAVVADAIVEKEDNNLIVYIATGAPLSSFDTLAYEFAEYARVNNTSITNVVFKKKMVIENTDLPYTNQEKIAHFREKYDKFKYLMDNLNFYSN